MPELPDVERIVREIRPRLLGRRIASVRLLTPASVRSPAPRAFQRAVRGQQIVDVSRRGKYILLRLERGTLAVHLRMTGFLTARPAGARPEGIVRAWLAFDDGTRLWFCDARRLGTLDWLSPGASLAGLETMGPEPLTAEFRLADFAAALRARRAPIKSVLLDQRVVAGIGNVYADEILFATRIHPRRQAAALRDAEIQLLHRAIRQILKRGVEFDGDDWARPRSFIDARQRALPCPRCRGALSSIAVGGRTTIFCGRCQGARGAEENAGASRIAKGHAATAPGSRWARERHR